MMFLPQEQAIEELRQVYPEREDHTSILFDVGVMSKEHAQTLVGVHASRALEDIPYVDSISYREPHRINKHYKNRVYSMLSGRNGRFVCRDGFPLFGTADELNTLEWMYLYFGNKGHYKEKVFRIPIHVHAEPGKVLQVRALVSGVYHDTGEIKVSVMSLDKKGGVIWYEYGGGIFGKRSRMVRRPDTKEIVFEQADNFYTCYSPVEIF